MKPPLAVLTDPRGAQALFSANLHAWRARQHLLLKEVAGRLGVSVSTLDAWERGRRFPTADRLDRLARLLGQPVCLLLRPARGPCPPRPGA